MTTLFFGFYFVISYTRLNSCISQTKLLNYFTIAPVAL